MNKGLYSSARPDWETPAKVFDPLHKEFGFTLDVCASPQNAKCPVFFTKELDGLAEEWAPDVCWMNPPYGKEISKWVAKAAQEARKGAVVVALLPARTDTAWWHDYCMFFEIRFLRGRVVFEGAKSSAPFPSAVVIFR